MSGCERFRTLVSDSLAGVDLPEADGPYRAHVGGCEDCESWAQSVYWQDRVLAELAGEARLDVLLERVRGTILNTSPTAVASETPPPLRIRRPRRVWPRRLAAAAAVAALALGAWLLVPRRPDTRVVVLPEVEKPTGTAVVKDVDTPPPPPPETRTLPENDEAPPPPVQPPPPPKKDATAKTAEPPTPKPPDVAEPPKDKKVAARPKDQIGPAIPAPIDLVERTTEQAIRLGVSYLKGKCEGLEGLKAPRDVRSTELVLWTMSHAGVPPADPDFQRLLKVVLERPLEQTYTVALQAMLLEELDRVTYQWRIHQCAQFLVDNQSRAGLWGYGAPSIYVYDIPTGAKAPTIRRPAAELDASGKPKVKTRIDVLKKRRDGAEGGDHSNSMYAALGLRACFDAGIRIPVAVVDLAQKAWREGQIKGEGGWCYGRHEAQAHKPYGSMTSGGVGSLVIYDYILGKEWKKDRDVKEGLDWLEKNFSVTWNPGFHEHAKAENSGHHLYYYLYALERAAILYGTEKIGKKDWYAEGSKSLLGAQRPDGSWVSKEAGHEVYDTCFAVLFLAKATRTLLPDVATGGRVKNP